MWPVNLPNSGAPCPFDSLHEGGWGAASCVEVTSNGLPINCSRLVPAPRVLSRSKKPSSIT